MTLAETLDTFLTDAAPVFEPYSVYIKDADCLHFYTRDVETVARRVDDVMTVYESRHDGHFAGCLVRGVKALVEQYAGQWGCQVYRDGKLEAKVALQAYASSRPAWHHIPQDARTIMTKKAKQAEISFS